MMRCAGGLAVLACLVTACTPSDLRGFGKGATATRTSAAPRAVPRLPLVHGGDHPGAAVLAGDARAPSGVAFVPAAADALSDIPPYWHHCHGTATQTAPDECTLGDTSRAPRKTIALVGDSATGAWMIPLDAIGKARHWKIVTLLHTRCTWTAAMTVHPLMGPGPYTACHTWGANVQRLLLRTKPDVVISTDRPVVRTPAMPTGGTGASIAVGRGMAQYWRQLLAHHIPVVAIRETPEPGVDAPHCLLTRSVSACSAPRSRAIARITPVTVAEAAVHHRAFLIDLNRYICGVRCSPVVGNVEVYRDVHHLTETFALTLAPYLERALLKVPALSNG